VRVTLTLSAAAIVAVVTGGVSSVIAGAPDIAEIAASVEKAVAPPYASTRRIDMTIHAPGGEAIAWTGRQARKVVKGEASMVTVLVGPDTVKGFAILVRDAHGEPDTQWVYLPPVRRVRRIVSTGRYESFLGTDFSYEDLGFVDMHDRTLTLVGEREHEGRGVYELREVPARPGPYSRVTTLVSKDHYLPVRREYHDPAGDLWKIAEYDKATVIDGTPTVLRMRIEDKQQGGSSELRVSEVSYNTKVKDELFDPAKLPEVAGHMMW